MALDRSFRWLSPSGPSPLRPIWRPHFFFLFPTCIRNHVRPHQHDLPDTIRVWSKCDMDRVPGPRKAIPQSEFAEDRIADWAAAFRWRAKPFQHLLAACRKRKIKEVLIEADEFVRSQKDGPYRVVEVTRQL